MTKFTADSWADARIEVRPSPIGGPGTFARAAIAAGEVVMVWGGSLFTAEEIKTGKAKPGTIAAVEEGIYLATHPDEDGHPVDFTNHSCDPNLRLIDAVTLATRRPVAAGEELTGDYAMWEADETYVAAWPCHCGSLHCRGRLTGHDWRRPELQARYRGHFSPFLERRIAALVGC